MSNFRLQRRARIIRTSGSGQFHMDVFASVLPAPVRLAPAPVAAPAPAPLEAPVLALVPALPVSAPAPSPEAPLVDLGGSDGQFLVELLVDGDLERVVGSAPSARVARLDASADGDEVLRVWALGGASPVLVWGAAVAA